MKRPFPVTVLGWLFILVGVVSSGFHLWKDSLDRWTLPILLVGIIAVVGGVFLLRGAGWARWLVLAWMAAHVVASAFYPDSRFAPHLVLLIVIGYCLLGPPTSEYFKSAHTE
jgi:hypothetical protein